MRFIVRGPGASRDFAPLGRKRPSSIFEELTLPGSKVNNSSPPSAQFRRVELPHRVPTLGRDAEPQSQEADVGRATRQPEVPSENGPLIRFSTTPPEAGDICNPIFSGERWMAGSLPPPTAPALTFSADRSGTRKAAVLRDSWEKL